MSANYPRCKPNSVKQGAIDIAAPILDPVAKSHDFKVRISDSWPGNISGEHHYTTVKTTVSKANKTTWEKIKNFFGLMPKAVKKSEFYVSLFPFDSKSLARYIVRDVTKTASDFDKMKS